MDNDLIYEASWDYAKSVISDTEKNAFCERQKASVDFQNGAEWAIKHIRNKLKLLLDEE